MSGFNRNDGALWCEQVPLNAIAANVGTPCFVYSKALLQSNCRAFQAAFDDDSNQVHLHYAVKAASTLAVLQTVFAQGFGADVVSMGEIKRCLQAGLEPKKIVFSGVGKTQAEIDFALEIGIGLFNVESLAELEQLAVRAQALNKTAALCLRVNPNIDAKTHPNITTGRDDNKFGLDQRAFLAALDLCQNQPALNYQGLSCHIGSQILTLEPLIAAAQAMVDLHAVAKDRGLKGRYLNLGGGVGIDYQCGTRSRDYTLPDYAHTLLSILKPTGAELLLEPGRVIVADSAKLITKVLYLKQNGDKRFVICDAGMTELPRPGLYDAYHHITALNTLQQLIAQQSLVGELFDIVGPVCESTDKLGLERRLQNLKAGDLLAIDDCGAYCASMQSNYNSRPFAAQVLVDGADYHVINQRQTIEQLWQNEMTL